MYSKAKLSEQVWLRVAGGRPNPDSKVHRDDVGPVVEAMIRAWYREYYFETKANEMQYGFDDNSLTSIEVGLSTDGEYKSGVLGVRPLLLPGGPAFADALPPHGSDGAVRIRGRAWLPGLQRAINTTFWWTEGQKVWVYNNVLLDNIVIRMIVDPGDTDDIMLPGNGEARVLAMATEFFTGQRQMPEDTKIDNIDIRQQ